MIGWQRTKKIKTKSQAPDQNADTKAPKRRNVVSEEIQKSEEGEKEKVSDNGRKRSRRHKGVEIGPLKGEEHCCVRMSRFSNKKFGRARLAQVPRRNRNGEAALLPFTSKKKKRLRGRDAGKQAQSRGLER